MVRFTNSDPDMLRLFITFLRQCHGVSDDRITLTITRPGAERADVRHSPPTVCSTALTQSIYGGIQEYAGLSGYRWLD